MKKIYFAALLSITMMTANAQEPNIQEECLALNSKST